MYQDKDIKKWDDYWQHVPERILHDEPKDWYGWVWKMGREYWGEIFNKYAKGKKMLECGAGSAKLSLYMARQGYDCTMLDNSPEGLKLGQLRFKREGLPGSFVLGDVTQMPFKTGTFEIVTSGGLLHHFHDIDKPIREMVRVLKKGGLCAAVVIPKKFSCQTLGNFEHFLVKFLKNLYKANLKGIISRSRTDQPFYVNSLSITEYVRAFESAGLHDITATGLSPFPSLALPAKGQELYGKFLKALVPFWLKFDRSRSKFTEIWGASFGIYGFKK